MLPFSVNSMSRAHLLHVGGSVTVGLCESYKAFMLRVYILKELNHGEEQSFVSHETRSYSGEVSNMTWQPISQPDLSGNSQMKSSFYQSDDCTSSSLPMNSTLRLHKQYHSEYRLGVQKSLGRRKQKQKEKKKKKAHMGHYVTLGPIRTY